MAMTDFGEYMCVVSNKWGSDTCKATVTLKPAGKMSYTMLVLCFKKISSI